MKFCICFSKVNNNFFSALPILSLISSISPSLNTEKLVFRLSLQIDELLSVSKFTFQAKWLPKLRGIARLKAIPQSL